MEYTYKLCITGSNQVIRKEDGASIPFDEDNVDYQEYLAWIAEGNEADPADSLDEENE